MKTPMQAIRHKCRWCSLDQAGEIKACASEKCPLWPLRSGKRVPGISPLKSIRAKCRDCVGGSPSEIRDCETKRCPLWTYRMGTNPNLAGKRKTSFRVMKGSVIAPPCRNSPHQLPISQRLVVGVKIVNEN